MPNTTVLGEPLLLNNTDELLSFSPHEQHSIVCHDWTETDRSAGRLLLTSAGTSRLLPKCWLKERHQASVYPFMLGTYFLTVSSLSRSHTPSSLWIYGKKKHQRAGHDIMLLWKLDGQQLTLSNTHTHTYTDNLWGCRKVSSVIRGQ